LHRYYRFTHFWAKEVFLFLQKAAKDATLRPAIKTGEG
jgi:hypothetical protein